jgi:DNA recombination protein RmuC
MDWLKVLGGVVVGAIMVWVLLRERLRKLERKEDEAVDAQAKKAAAEARAQEIEKQSGGILQDLKEVRELNTKLAVEKKAVDERARLVEKEAEWLQEREKQLKEAFSSLATDALKTNADAFLTNAKTALETLAAKMSGGLSTHKEQVESLLKPLSETLEKMDEQVRTLEIKREGAYGELKEKMENLVSAEKELRGETSSLRRALKASPTERGRWGELQLRNLVKLAGMEQFVDFDEQVTTDTGRPDMTINMPNGGILPVDAKVPLQAYIEAVDEDNNDARESKLREHAEAFRSRVSDLSKKEYWDQFKGAAKLVVMFVPVEASVAAAFEYKSDLFEEALKKGVLIATPITLFALLHAFAYGWMQHQAAKNVQQITDLGKELYERFLNFKKSIEVIGEKMGDAVEAYDKAMGSFNKRLLPSAKRFGELRGDTAGLTDVSYIKGDAIPEGQEMEGAQEDAPSA